MTLWMLVPGTPFLLTMEIDIAPPTGLNGEAFCTVKYRPFTDVEVLLEEASVTTGAIGATQGENQIKGLSGFYGGLPFFNDMG